MTANTPVELTKLSTERDTGPHMLRERYWLRGKLLAALVVGEPIIVARTARSGRELGEPAIVECPGVFESSPVSALEPQPDGSVIAATANSRWRVSPVECAA